MRVIVRRPHAYFLIDALFEDRGGIESATPEGCALADGSIAPLPGVYVLDGDGKIEGSSTIAREPVLELLEAGD